MFFQKAKQETNVEKLKKTFDFQLKRLTRLLDNKNGLQYLSNKWEKIKVGISSVNHKKIIRFTNLDKKTFYLLYQYTQNPDKFFKNYGNLNQKYEITSQGSITINLRDKNIKRNAWIKIFETTLKEITIIINEIEEKMIEEGKNAGESSWINENLIYKAFLS